MCACQDYITSFELDSSQQQGQGMRLSPHMKKSHMSIQKMPASAPMTCSLSRSCGVHRVSLSDHLPFHEYFPHGLRRRINLKRMNVALELLKLQVQVHRQEISRTTKTRHFTSPSFLLSNFFFPYQDSLQLISLNLCTTQIVSMHALKTKPRPRLSPSLLFLCLQSAGENLETRLLIT